ncbi:MAG: sigma-54 dependent transcriptional regulator [Gemmatimonadales bacterium]
MIVVGISDSFGDSVRGLVEEAGLEWRDRAPEDRGPFPSAAGCLVLAGGAEPDGLDWLGRTSRPNGLATVLVGAAPDHRLAIGAATRGARDYLVLPGDLDLLRRTLDRLARDGRGAEAAEEFVASEKDAAGFGAIIGESAALRASLAGARRVAAIRDVTVLIGGETGTGKELLARAIHLHSPRAKAPFVEINCAAIPANLIESELFGHEKGAFTGAVSAKPGLFEVADGGTVFLDEVGHLPLDLQPKLLRALEAREIRRVGGQATKRVDVRVVAATHVDLEKAVRDGTFREDLYYRLNVIHLVLPPLRDRGSDIVLLASAFVKRLAAQHGMPVPELDEPSRRALVGHSWPGNIPRAAGTIERALVLSPPGALELADLGGRTAAVADAAGPLPFPALCT